MYHLKSKHNIHLWLVQDLHILNSSMANQWCQEWGRAAFFSYGSNHVGGVGILLNSDDITVQSPPIIYDSNPILSGRVLQLEISFQNKHFTIFSVYAPVNSQLAIHFWQELSSIPKPPHAIMMGGDFNTYQNGQIDKIPPTTICHPAYAHLDSLLTVWGLSDIFRHHHLYKNEPTYWDRTYLGSGSRIDRLYLSSYLLRQWDAPRPEAIGRSDHLALICEGRVIHRPHQWRGFARFCFNSSLLDIHEFTSEIENLIARFEPSKKKYDPSMDRF